MKHKILLPILLTFMTSSAQAGGVTVILMQPQDPALSMCIQANISLKDINNQMAQRIQDLESQLRIIQQPITVKPPPKKRSKVSRKRRHRR